MYSPAIRQMMEFVLHLERSMVHTLTINRSISFSTYNHKYNWDGKKLSITAGSSNIAVIKPHLILGQMDNYLPISTTRINIKFNNTNIKTRLNDDMVVLTGDMCVDEGTYFQHSIFADLPDYNQVLDIYKVSLELIENNVSYVGSFKIPLIDMDTVVRHIEHNNPETFGYWERYKNAKHTGFKRAFN